MFVLLTKPVNMHLLLTAVSAASYVSVLACRCSIYSPFPLAASLSVCSVVLFFLLVFFCISPSGRLTLFLRLIICRAFVLSQLPRLSLYFFSFISPSLSLPLFNYSISSGEYTLRRHRRLQHFATFRTEFTVYVICYSS